MKKSLLEQEFLLWLNHAGIKPTPEYRFHPERKWRFDFALPEKKIAFEVEGGVWVQGRHSRGKGFVSDCEKYNSATTMGWVVLRYTKELFKNIRGDYDSLSKIRK